MHRLRSSLPRHAAALVVAALLASPTAAFATADAEDGVIRWAVTPSDAAAPDGRVFIEHTVDPGETIEDHLAVRNLSDQVVTFRLAAADGFYNERGRFDMLPSGQPSVGAGLWVQLASSVEVGPGETAVVPFAVGVPDDAEPGDHAAGITASVLSAGQDGVGVESRVGFRVMTRVTGELRPVSSVSGVAAGYDLNWNPLSPGRAVVSFDIVNDGNTRIVAGGSVEIAGQQVAFPVDDGRSQEILPGQSRRFEVDAPGVWPLLTVAGTVVAAPTAITLDGAELVVDSSRTDFTVWALPVPQVLALLGIALVAGAILWNRVAARRRLAMLLAGAREEGRRDAASKGEQP